MVTTTESGLEVLYEGTKPFLAKVVSPSSIMIGERVGDSIFLLLVTPVNFKQGDNFGMQLSRMFPILAAPAEPEVPVFTPEENRADCTAAFPHCKFD